MELFEFETLLKEAIKNKTIENIRIIEGEIKFNFITSIESSCPNTNFFIESKDSTIKVIPVPSLTSKQDIIFNLTNDKPEYIDLINLIRNDYNFQKNKQVH